MGRIVTEDYEVLRLKQHIRAIRDNKFSVAHIFLFLSEDPPNASAAREALEELSRREQIALWSVSTTAGGVWERWERDALKYGELRESYDIWRKRLGVNYK